MEQESTQVGALRHRSDCLKREIKAFLDDKRLLRQLEDQERVGAHEFTNNVAIKLLREQIVQKSTAVGPMVEELNWIKRELQPPSMLLDVSSMMAASEDGGADSSRLHLSHDHHMPFIKTISPQK